LDNNITDSQMRDALHRVFFFMPELNSGNFGRKSNGKVCFGPFRSEYLGPAGVVHFNRSDRSARNLPFQFEKLVRFPTSLQQIFLYAGD